MKRSIAVAVFALLGSTAAYTQEKEINDTRMGTLRHEGNAMLNDSKVDDPSEYRGGAPPTQRSLVKISGDVVDGARREEVVLIQLKQTGDDVPDHQRGGEFYLGLKIPGTGTTDDAMFDALVATYRDGFHFNLPIYAPNLQGTVVGTWAGIRAGRRTTKMILSTEDQWLSRSTVLHSSKYSLAGMSRRPCRGPEHASPGALGWTSSSNAR